MTDTTQDRCRLVLIAPPPGEGNDERVIAALSGGDVASLILPVYDLGEAAFQKRAERLTPPAQQHGLAVIIAGEPRMAARVKADGIHVEDRKSELADTIRRYREQMIVGCGGIKTRDDALELGETQPDYVFFGRFGYDTRPEPHSRNLALAEWWSQMIELPCIVLGGSDIASVEAVAAAGADFVALSGAVFAEGASPAERVARANALLDERAPRFTETAR